MYRGVLSPQMEWGPGLEGGEAVGVCRSLLSTGSILTGRGLHCLLPTSSFSQPLGLRVHLCGYLSGNTMRRVSTRQGGCRCLPVPRKCDSFRIPRILERPSAPRGPIPIPSPVVPCGPSAAGCSSPREVAPCPGGGWGRGTNEPGSEEAGGSHGQAQHLHTPAIPGRRQRALSLGPKAAKNDLASPLCGTGCSRKVPLHRVCTGRLLCHVPGPPG